MSRANLNLRVTRWHSIAAFGVAGVLAWGAWCGPARGDVIVFENGDGVFEWTPEAYCDEIEEGAWLDVMKDAASQTGQWSASSILFVKACPIDNVTPGGLWFRGDWFGARVSIGNTIVLVGSQVEEKVSPPLPKTAGEVIGPLDRWSISAQATHLQDAAHETTPDELFFESGMIGVKLFADDGIHYGWVELEYVADGPYLYNSFYKPVRWAYETEPGVPVTLGDVRRLCENPLLVAPDGQTEDSFGHSVDFTGETMFVGAFRDDGGGEDAGVVHVHTRLDGSWSRSEKWLAADGQPGDFFGYDLAAAGSAVIVGAPRADEAGTNSGAAYVFRQTGGVWTQEAKLVPSDGKAGDQFGYSVGISGQIAVVGAWMADLPGRANSGAVYVFERDGPEERQWTEVAKLVAEDGNANDLFGRSVAVEGDWAFVGAPGNDNANGADSGAVYFFVEYAGDWPARSKLTAPDGGPGDKFGFSVAATSARLLIGAPGSDLAAPDAGAAWTYAHVDWEWNLESAMTLGDAQPGDAAGSAVAMSGSFALIGAWMSDRQGVDSGAASLFMHDGNGWAEDGMLTGASIGAGDFLSAAVGIGPGTLAVGAIHAEGPGGPEQGAVVVYSTGGCPCYADFTGDGTLDLFDFLAYQNAFYAGGPGADCDGNGGLDLFDFLCFVNAFNTGC